MAARTSISPGLGITIGLLGAISLGLFVVTIILYGDNIKYVKQIDEADQNNRDFVREVDRADPAIQGDLRNARSAGVSLVRYLSDSLNDTFKKVTGNENDRLAELETKTQSIDGASTNSMLGLVQRQLNQITTLERQLADAEAARLAAQTNLQREADRVTALQAQQTQTVNGLQATIAELQDAVDGYRAGFQSTEQQYIATINQLRADLEASEQNSRTQIRELQQQKLLLEDQVSALQLAGRGESLKPKDEHSLVDGTVANTNPNESEVYVSIGRRDKVVLGMTFAIYGDSTQIRPDEDGNYPQGKGAVEVINVGETSSRCRVLFERAGNPIVPGDVIANAAYDPNKVYKFLIAGNFDTNGDGRRTPGERTEITAFVEEWGGTTTEELEGDVDFVVLGEPPILPPQPNINSPIEIVEIYIRRENELNRYNDLLDKAQRTSIPVLNENRLYTLIGRVRSRTR